MKRGSSIIGTVCVALATTALLSAQAADSEAPDFNLKTLAGDSVRLSSLKGHPVFLNFWATWCKPCRAELPALFTASDAHQQAGLEVLAITLTDHAPIHDLRQLPEHLPLPFPI